MVSFYFKDKLITFGIAGGAFLGLLNVFATFITVKRPDVKSYFIRTIIKFAVILAAFYFLLKIRANVFAILGGFAVPLLFLSIEAMVCKFSKKP